MGYFKNEIIANQVELGDRVPDLKPATSHIALTRRQTRDARNAARERAREWQRATRGLIWAGALIGLTFGLLMGAIVAEVWL